MGRFTAPFEKRSKDDQKLPKLTRDTGRLAVEQIKGISSQVGAAAQACIQCSYHINCSQMSIRQFQSDEWGTNVGSA
jgi:hypothetical protein